jgi:lysophospholipase L1-like esterase
MFIEFIKDFRNRMAWKTTFVGLLMVTSLVNLPYGVWAQNGLLERPAAVRPDNGPILNPAALSSFFRRLAATEAHRSSRPVVVMQYGDSHTKADLFTGAVRRNLQSQFSQTGLLQSTALQPGRAGEAVVYQPLGVNGARAKRLREMAGSEAFLQSVRQRNPDLIVLAYGTNEVTDNDWTVDSYQQLFVEIVNRFHTAAPNASILIMGPPDRAVAGASGWASARRMPAMIEAQRRAAYSAGAAYWSACEAMGGDGSMNTWFARGLAQPDRVHFNAKGYYRLGDLFFNDLMATYRGTSPAELQRRAPASSPRSSVSDADMKLMQGVPLTSGSRY